VRQRKDTSFTGDTPAKKRTLEGTRKGAKATKKVEMKGGQKTAGRNHPEEEQSDSQGGKDELKK